MTKILVFAGSTRGGSYNKLLARAAAASVERAGGQPSFIDLRDFAMPLYDGDLEDRQGLPENARRLKQLFLEHQGLLIASPEYNSSITGVLKNSLDWVSRSETDDETPLAAYRGKVAGLVSASPGSLGGLRSLLVLRMMLENIKVFVVPEQLAVSGADSAFDSSGQLADPKRQKALDGVARALVTVTSRLSSKAA